MVTLCPLCAQVHATLQQLVERVQADCPGALQELAETKRLTAAAEEELLRVMAGARSIVTQAQT